MYWTSCIIQEPENAEPRLCACSEGCFDLTSAIEQAAAYVRNYRCLSVWVDRIDAPRPGSETRAVTVYHKCMIRPDGSVVRSLDDKA